MLPLIKKSSLCCAAIGTLALSHSPAEANENYAARLPMESDLNAPKQLLNIPTAKYSVGKTLKLHPNSRIALIGGGLGSRMNIYNEFETELQARYPDYKLFIRNLCKEGDTPAFRPHPSRGEHWVIPGGKELIKEEFRTSQSKGHYETPDQWLIRLQVDTVIGFFGYSESFDGEAAAGAYKNELRAFIKHTLAQNYNGKNSPQLAIVSPATFEDLSAKRDLPNGEVINANLELYTKAMAEVCAEEGVLFFDAFSTTAGFYNQSKVDLTSNGHNLTGYAYKNFAPALANGLFGKKEAVADTRLIKSAVTEKNRLWLLDYKIPNGVHVHGRRHKPYGKDNYPEELEKTREMTAFRDRAIWAANVGKGFKLKKADTTTKELTPITSNSDRKVEYKSGQEVAEMLEMADGYKVELFADETRFPDLANPSQMAFDNKGRLWVSCMASYPHYKIGDPAPNDKILIFEDTNGDGKADRQKTFIDHIHIPMGFELTEHGVFISLGNDLVLLKDTNGDDKADVKEIILSGFDDHDTHHAISAFCADPSGAIYMAEGWFSHSNVETPYGPVRGVSGGFYRYNQNKGKLERTAQYEIPNPWGIAFDDWGQNFFLHTSGSAFSWMQAAAVKPKFSVNLASHNLLNSNNVRPTSGLEIVSSRHFPDEVQGDVLLCNNIGYLGAKQHTLEADPNSGFFKSMFRQDLFKSPGSYQYFRPVDLEFAPDGSLYFVDWSNVLIGHMQHNARDPKRDHVHGRIYRVTYPSRPLVKPAKVAGATIEQLLENLKLHEYRTRYRTRRELRGRDRDKVLVATQKWVKALDPSNAKYEHYLLEALWVTWGINKIDTNLLESLLNAKDYRARVAAVRAARYNADKYSNAFEAIRKAAGDVHPQVRHEAVIAASWMGQEKGLLIVEEANKQPHDNWWSGEAYKHAEANLKGEVAVEAPEPKIAVPTHVPATFHASYRRGKKLYEHGENCWSCHQQNGQGITPAFPPLDGSKWVISDKDLLAKIALHGVSGEMIVAGEKYNGAMPGFAFRKDNKEIADMLTYVRNAWSNKCGDGYTESEIEALLKKTEKPGGMYKVEEILKQHQLK